MQNLQKCLKIPFQTLNFKSIEDFSVKHVFHKFSQQQIPFQKWHILRGDKVILLSGKDKGKSGTVLKVYRKSNKVKVEGINTVKELISEIEKKKSRSR